MSGHDFAMCGACFGVVPAKPVAVRCAQCGHYSMIPLSNTKGLTLEAAQVYAANIAGSGDRIARMKRRWVVTFAQCMKELRTEPRVAEATVALFYIRLHGLLVELPASMRKGGEIFSSMSPAENARLPPTTLAVARWHEQTAVALQRMRDALSDDMLLYLDWRRQVECHMKQSAFQLQLNGPIDKERWVKTSARISTVDREVTVQQLWDALERTQHGDDDDHAVARAFAERLDKPAMELVQAWFAYDPW